MTSGTNEQRALFKGAHVVSEDYSRRRERKWVTTESKFERCSFAGIRATDFDFGAAWAPSNFTECSFDDVNIRAEIPGFATFERYTFARAKMYKWICYGIEFIDCSFDEAIIRDCVFSATVKPSQSARTDRVENSFSGNDFSRADFFSVIFKGGVDLSRQRLPTGEGYLLIEDAPTVFRRALADVQSWTDLDAKRYAEVFLRAAIESMGRSQQQYLLSPHDLTHSNPVKAGAYKSVGELITRERR